LKRELLLTRQDTCIDVEHKKRGRPRIAPPEKPGLIRDPLGQQAVSPLRHPGHLDIHAPERRPSLPVAGLESPFNERPYLQQVPHSAGPNVSSFRDQLPDSDPCVAFLSTSLEFLKVSRSFQRLFEQPLYKKNLRDAIHPDHRVQLSALEEQFSRERGQFSQPNTLAPLRGAEVQVLEHLDFADHDDLGRGFQRTNGTWLFRRQESSDKMDSIEYRIGLAQRGSFFFVVLFIRPGSHLHPPQRTSYGASSSREIPGPSSWGRSEPTSPFSSMPQHLATTLPSVGPSHSPSAPPYFEQNEWYNRRPRSEHHHHHPPPLASPTLSGPHSSSISARLSYPHPPQPPPPPNFHTTARAIRPTSLSLAPLNPSNSAPATPNRPDATFWEAGVAGPSSRRQSMVQGETPGSGTKRRASDGKTDEEEDSQGGNARKKGRLMDIGDIINE